LAIRTFLIIKSCCFSIPWPPIIDAFFKPITDLVENIKDDMESEEWFKLYVQDELSSAK
jgi:hypothetical protein